MENGSVVQRSSVRERGLVNDAFEMNDHPVHRSDSVCSPIYVHTYILIKFEHNKILIDCLIL